MMTIKTISIVVLIVIISSFTLSMPSMKFQNLPLDREDNCRGCNTECDKCQYGVAISPVCGILECRKGPAELCGGAKGVCGDGMICVCDRCIGCSMDTLKCADEKIIEYCLPHKNRDSRYLSMEHDNRFTLVK